MELSPKQQALELIKNSNKILLTTHARPDGDAIGSLIAIFLVLKKLGRDVTAVLSDAIPRFLSFLPGTGEISSSLSGSRDFIISIDQSKTKASSLSYSIDGDRLNIVIVPSFGEFKPSDVVFSQGAFKFDLIIILDCPDFDQIGKTFDENASLFLETPTINIDHHATNEYYATVNLVDLTATSTCEILVGVLEALGKELIDENVATCLLAGIITDTGSFQHSNTTPKSFTIAAQLIANGARQQEIIKYIYKTKPLTTLKLWGRVLSKIRQDKENRMVWSVVSYQDLIESGAGEEEISGVIDELLSSAPETDVVFLISERKPRLIYCSLRTAKGVSASKIATSFGGGGHQEAAGFRIENADLGEAEAKIVARIRQFQKEKLGEREDQKKPAQVLEQITPEEDLVFAPTVPDSEQSNPIIEEESDGQNNDNQNQNDEKYPLLSRYINMKEKKKKQFRPPHL